MLDPELIFIANSSGEFIFTVYPCGTHCVETEFQQMMEFLLTRVDHKDDTAVRASYDIYEKTLQEGYSILDIRDGIMQGRQEPPEPTVTTVSECGTQRVEHKNLEEKTEPAKNRSKVSEKPSIRQRLLAKLVEWGFLDEVRPAENNKKTESRPEKRAQKKADKKLARKAAKEEKKSGEVVYPQEEVQLPPPPVIRPTVCLTSLEGKPRGFLLYQGRDQLEDISLSRGITCIGNGSDADILIDRDTVSKMHAKIDCENSSYYIEDLNSTNGTFVNEEPLAYKERRMLKTNDIVSFADIRYRFT
jgi:hypothetical protein